MLKSVDHLQGVQNGEEILFDTPFGYLFEYLCSNADCRLPDTSDIVDHLLQLGLFMADPGVTGPPDALESSTPAIYTYLGQFIDHDITARTDRDGDFVITEEDGSQIPITPADPDEVIDKLKNGRRPNFDLDSVFGDGPSFSSAYATQADDLYDADLKLKINRRANYIDLNRDADTGTAVIADHRNDENLMVSQLHAAFIAFYNRAYDSLINDLSRPEKYSRARQLTEWAYQCMVVNDYLPQICNPDIVRETLANGPYYFGPYSNAFMPLEFSVAGFRFGHSMIRPSYRVNNVTRPINQLLGVSNPNNGMLDPARNFELKSGNVIGWADFAFMNKDADPQMTRKIDTKIAQGLFQLDHISPDIPPNTILARLTQRNLLRGYLFSLPTGQSVAKAMRIFPMTDNELKMNNSTAENDFLTSSGLLERTPLWYYVLKEAEVHQNGERLGAVGSKIVAETMIGLLKKDQNSYLHHSNDKAVTEDGIKLRFRAKPVKTMKDILEYAKVPVTTLASTVPNP